PVAERGEDDYLGYDVTDYASISEACGSPEDFENLLAEAHELELKVIVDMQAVATGDYTALETPAIDTILEEYYEEIGRDIIELNDAGSQETCRAMVQEFTDTYDVDGISMFVNQDGLNAEEFLPANIDTYGILSTEEITAEGFDTIAREGFRADL